MNNNPPRSIIRIRLRLNPKSLLTLVLAACYPALLSSVALALPQGPQVVAGQAAISQPAAGRMNITVSNGAIINWRDFSIGAGEAARFLQPSASSAVLNRVTGPNISQLLGQLQANGRVFLINPNGIVIGSGARIDTNGFIASTLDIADNDFLAGKLRFIAAQNAGSIVNRGVILAGTGGQVILLAPNIENSGLIEAPGGELLLAAGRSIELASARHDGITFEIQAPSDSVINLGRLIADNGAISIFAGTLRNSGEIRANRLAQGSDGSIYLSAGGELDLAAGGSIRSDGPAGGAIRIDAGAGTARIAGAVSATGAEGSGGDILVTGSRIALESGARLDASGAAGGGQIRVGGDYQGRNPDVANAQQVYVDADARLVADATQQGDGGRIIVWADGSTRYFGALSARGGPAGGNGGFAEVSGKTNLEFAGTADLGAPAGALGRLLLDPLDILVAISGGILTGVVDQFADFPNNIATISPATLAAISGQVTLQANRNIYFNDPLALGGGGIVAEAGGVTHANGSIYLNQGITTTGGPVNLSGYSIYGSGGLSSNGGAITLNTVGTLNSYSGLIASGGGTVNATSSGGSINYLNINAGAGTANLATPSGSINQDTITAGTAALNARDSIYIYGTVNASGRIDASSTNSYIELFNSGGQPLRVGTLSAPNSSIYLYASSGLEQASGGRVTTPRLYVYAQNGAGTIGSPSAPLSVASPQLDLNNLSAPAYVAFYGSPTVTEMTLTGNLAGLSGTSISGAANLSTFNLANAGGTLQANVASSGGFGSGFTLQVSDAGLSLPTLSLAGAPVTLTAAGPVSLAPAGSPTVGSLNLTVSKCGYYGYNCSFSSPVNIGNLTATNGSVNITDYDNGNISVSGANTAGGISVSAGYAYFYPPYYNRRTSSISMGSISAVGSVNVTDYGTGALTATGNLSTSAGDLTLTAQDGGITTGGTVSAAYSLSMTAGNGSITATAGALSSGYGATLSANNGAISFGTLTTANGNTSLSARDNISFQSVAAGGSYGDVSMTSTQGAILTTLDNAAADVSAGRNVTLTAADATNGRLGDGSYTNPLDIAAGATATVALTAGRDIGSASHPVTVDFSGASTNAALNVSAGGLFNVTTPDTLRSLSLTASAAGVGAGNSANLVSQDLSIAAASDGSTLTIGDINPTNQGTHALDKFAFSASGTSNLVFGNANLATSGGYNMLALSAGGTLTQASGNISAGDTALAAGASSAALLNNITVAAVSGVDNTLTISGGDITAGTISAPSLNVSGANLLLGSVASTGTNRGYASLAVYVPRQGNYNYVTDQLGLTATGNITTSGNISSPTSTALSAGGNITVAGGAGTVGAGTSYYYYGSDTLNVSATGTLASGDLNGGYSSTISANTLQTGNIGAGSTNLNLTATGNYQPGAIALNAGGTLSITAPGGIDLTTNNATLSSPNVTLHTGGGNISANLTGTNTLYIVTGGRFTVSSSAALNYLDVTADASAATGAGASSVSGPGGQLLNLHNSGGVHLDLTSSAYLNAYYRESSTIGNLALSSSLPAGLGTFYVSAPAANLTTSSISGGNLNLNTAGAGGIALNGVATGGDYVSASASGTGGIAFNSVNTGGGWVSASAAGGDIGVTSLVTNGGIVTLSSSAGSITASGGGTHIDTAYNAAAAGTVSLSAQAGSIGAANALNLANVLTLNLAAHDTIAVNASGASGTLTNLSVDTTAGGSGAIAISSPNHAGLSITRGSGELVLGAVNPATAGSFALTARDGGLRVNGDIGNVTDLGLNAGYDAHVATADLTIAASGGPRSINASGTLDLRAGRDILMTAGSGGGNNLAVQGGTSYLIAGRDILLGADGGNASLASTSYQQLQAGGNITLAGGANGTLLAPAYVSASSGGNQYFNAGGDFLLQAGSSDGAYARAQAANSQTLYANNFSVLGGGNSAFAEMTGAYQNFTYIHGNATLLGGSGSGAYARVASGGYQYFGSESTYGNNPTDDITVQGGTGSGAYASLSAGSTQYVYGGGNIGVLGGGSSAYAEIASGGSQTVGYNYTYYYDPTANVTVQGGNAANAYASIRSANGQSVTGGGNISVTAGPAAGAYAEIVNTAGSQTIGNNTNYYYYDPTEAITLAAAAATGAYAQVRSVGGDQQVYATQNVTLTGGTGDNANAMFSAGGAQSLATYGSLAIGGGTPATPGLNRSGLYAGGAGQNVSVSGSISITGGGAGADAQIQQTGAGGTQVISAGTTLTLTSPTAGAGTTSIETSGSAQTLQIGGATLLSNAGGQTVALSSGGTQMLSTDSLTLTQSSSLAGASTLVSAGTDQSITLNGTGAAGTATLSLNNAGGGSGSATRVSAGGNQNILMDYASAGAFTVGAASDTGESIVQAGGNQTVVAGSLLLQGGATAAARAKVNVVGNMTVSTLYGNVDVLGGAAGPAAIDPVNLDMLANGGINVQGGAAATATAQIIASGNMNLAATNGNINVLGGAAPSAAANITGGGAVNIFGAGNMTIAPNAGGAGISGGGPSAYNILGNCTGCDLYLFGGPWSGIAFVPPSAAAGGGLPLASDSISNQNAGLSELVSWLELNETYFETDENGNPIAIGNRLRQCTF